MPHIKTSIIRCILSIVVFLFVNAVLPAQTPGREKSEREKVDISLCLKIEEDFGEAKIKSMVPTIETTSRTIAQLFGISINSSISPSSLDCNGTMLIKVKGQPIGATYSKGFGSRSYHYSGAELKIDVTSSFKERKLISFQLDEKISPNRGVSSRSYLHPEDAPIYDLYDRSFPPMLLYEFAKARGKGGVEILMREVRKKNFNSDFSDDAVVALSKFVKPRSNFIQSKEINEKIINVFTEYLARVNAEHCEYRPCETALKGLDLLDPEWTKKVENRINDLIIALEQPHSVNDKEQLMSEVIGNYSLTKYTDRFDSKARLRCLSQLKYLSHHTTNEIFIEALEDNEQSIRILAMDELGKRKNNEAVDILMKRHRLLVDRWEHSESYKYEIITIIRTLGSIGDPRATKVLHIPCKYNDLTAEYINALAMTGGKRTIKTLETTAKPRIWKLFCNDKETREAAANALEKYKKTK